MLKHMHVLLVHYVAMGWKPSHMRMHDAGDHLLSTTGLRSDHIINPFAHSLRASLDALATSHPSVTREAQRGCRHGVSGDRAVQCDHAALS